ncbi:TPM domain-containing protein [Sphingomonas sp. CJ20]
MDGADLLPPAQEAALADRLADAEARTKHQFVVVTVTGLGGHAIEDYGRALGNFWGIGRARVNDGVLLIVALNERKTRVEVGYGLEKALTDGEAAHIIDSDILPSFRQGKMADGILAGSNAIIRETTP